MTDLRAFIAALCVLAACAVGFYGGVMYQRSLTAPEVIEPAPEVRQNDGSVVLERDPKPADEPAPHVIPRGHVEERRVSVIVQPRPGTNTPQAPGEAPETPAGVPVRCLPVRVDLSLVRDTEGGRRVIASSPDGQVLGGLDVPIIPGSVFMNRKWAVGVSYDPFDGTPGAWVERDYGRIRIGADLYQERNALASGLAIRLRVGWTF